MSTDWLGRDLSILTLRLLKGDALIALRSNLARAWPADQRPSFERMLQAIDEADSTGSPDRIAAGASDVVEPDE